MAATPRFKVYDRFGEYQAAVKEIEAAACLMGLYGSGATIRLHHSWVVWREGQEDQPGFDSYDHVGCVVTERIAAGRKEGK